MVLLSTLGVSLLAVPALGQTLNSWSQEVFTNADAAFDGNPDTYYENNVLPVRISILFNSWSTYLGFYVQSSGSYITDYYVNAVDPSTDTDYIIGKVTNATSNFTVINFYNADGEAKMYTDTMFLTVTGTKDNGTAIVNEIYPIYPGDEIVYPSGQSASPSPTQPPSTTPTPTTTIYPTPTASGLTLNPWPTSGSLKPIPIGGSNSSALVDGDPSTASSETLVTNLGYPGSYDLLFNGITTYAGLYILSESPNFLTAYHVTAQNTTTYASYEVCRITGATSNFTVCSFINEAGVSSYRTGIITIYPDSVYGGGDTAIINEIYPIYPGDTIVDLS